jgi:hypothetical protein
VTAIALETFCNVWYTFLRITYITDSESEFGTSIRFRSGFPQVTPPERMQGLTSLVWGIEGNIHVCIPI